MTGPRTISVPVVFALVAGVGLVSLTVGVVFLLSIRNPVAPPTQSEPFKPLPDRPKVPNTAPAPKLTPPIPVPKNMGPVADPVRTARLESAPAPRPSSRYNVGNAVEQEVVFTRKSVYHVQGIEVAQAAEYSVISDVVVDSVTPDGGCTLTQTIRSTRLTHCDPALRQEMQAALEKTHGTRFAIVVGPDGELRDFKSPNDGVNIQVPNDPGRTATFRVWSLIDAGAWRELAEITLLQPPANRIENAWDRPISHDWGPLGAWAGRTTFRPNGQMNGQNRIDFSHNLTYRPPAADVGEVLPLKVVRAEFRKPLAAGSVLYDANLGRVTRAEETFQVRGRVIVAAITSDAAIDLEERQDFQLTIREPKERNLRGTPKQ